MVYRNFSHNYDLKNGIKFGVLSGLGIGLINLGHGLGYAFSSGGKEAAKVVAIGSFNMSICKKFAQMNNKYMAYSFSVVVPSVIGALGTYLVHRYIEGTPEPLLSSLPAVISNPIFFGWFANRERKKEKVKDGGGLVCKLYENKVMF